MCNWIDRLKLVDDLEYLLKIFNIRFDILIYKLILLEISTKNKIIVQILIKFMNKLATEYYIYNQQLNRYKYIEKTLRKRFSRLSVEKVFIYLL